MNINMGTLLRGAALTLSAVALAACGSSNNGGGAPAGNGTTITIKNFGYGDPLTVAPGTTVTVTQQDSVQHDVSSSAFKTKLLNKGESATFTAPNQPGSYDFTCSIHPNMHGKLIVSTASGTASGDFGAPGGY